MVGPPLVLVSVDIGADLGRTGAERSDVGPQLLDLTGLGIHREPGVGECRAEPRIRGDRGMADAVDRLDHVPHANRMQAPPGARREHARVDLQVQMPMGIPCP
jgi:hypothetical protein